jgi:hypothetical protein
MVTAINGEGQNLVLNEKGYAPTDALCCRSLRFTQDFNWNTDLRRFVGGPLIPPSCTSSQLKVTQSALIGPGDRRGVLLRYVNTGPNPCHLNGYPQAAVVDAAGRLLAEATPIPTLPEGGLVPAGATSKPSKHGSWSAVIEWETVESDGAQCYPHARLESTPPGATAAQSFGDQGRVCYLRVHRVVPDDALND